MNVANQIFEQFSKAMRLERAAIEDSLHEWEEEHGFTQPWPTTDQGLEDERRAFAKECEE